MHLKISQLLTEKSRLLKPTLLAAMILRLFCHTWIILIGSSYPKISPHIGGCCLLAPSIPTSSRTCIPASYCLEAMLKSMAWLNSLSMQHREPVRLHCTLSWELWDTAMPPFPRKNSSTSDTWFLLISSPPCPLTALDPVPVQQSGSQKNVNIKFYRTKAQHSLICNAFCMKCPFPRVCHWGRKCNVTLRYLVLLHHFLLHNSRLKVYFAFLRKGNKHKNHVDLFHGLY